MRGVMVPGPDYYLGYIIQPVGSYYYVYDRRDTQVPVGGMFGSYNEAIEYIDDLIDRERLV